MASEDGPTTYFGERTEDPIVCSWRTPGLMCSRCGSWARLRPSQKGAKKMSTPANPVGLDKGMIAKIERRQQMIAFRAKQTGHIADSVRMFKALFVRALKTP